MSADLPGIEDWRKLVSESLKGRDFDSLRSKTSDRIIIEPLYERRRDTQPLPGRGAQPWTIIQPVDDPDPDKANEQAIADIRGGATGLSLRFAGRDSSADFGLPPTKHALRVVLDGVDAAEVHLWLEPHPLQLETALWAKDLVLSSGVAPELAHVSFGLNPFVAVTTRGIRSLDTQAYAEAFKALRATAIFGKIAMIDGRPYHEAGATEAQELAAMLASAAWWMRTLDDAGVGVEESLLGIGASLCVDRDLLLSLAKVRALRLLKMRFAELCGETRWHLNILAQTSRRMLTRADPHANLLRNTLAAFAAAVGGADEILVLPHTAPAGIADRNARALARNIQHLLIGEAHVASVADPGAGSGAIENLTEALAERAWAEFQAIEREGGIAQSLGSGAFQQRIADARDVLVKEVASGRAPLVGSTLYATGAANDEITASVKELHDLAPICLEALAKAAP